MTSTHNPLPNLGLCPVCQREIRVRKAGALYAHHCDGDGREPAARLEPTFARWLHAQAGRRDYHENRITHLAQTQFHGCTRSPNRTPADVTWTSAEELHGHRHLIQLARTGSDAMVPYSGERCDWRCRDILHAGEVYDQLLAARDPS